MSFREQVQRIIARSEVDHIDRGADHITSMQERERERVEQSVARRAAPTTHQEVHRAAQRRLRLIK